jgi:hypothetical protein
MTPLTALFPDFDKGLARVEAMQMLRHHVVMAHTTGLWRQQFKPVTLSGDVFITLKDILPEARILQAKEGVTQFMEGHRQDALKVIREGQVVQWREADKAYAAARAAGLTHRDIVTTFRTFISDRFKEQEESLRQKLPKKPVTRKQLEVRARVGDPRAAKRLEAIYGDDLKGPEGTKHPFAPVLDTIRTLDFLKGARIRFKRAARKAAKAAATTQS